MWSGIVIVRSERLVFLALGLVLLASACSHAPQMGSWSSSEVRVQSFPARDVESRPLELGALASLPPGELTTQWEATLDAYMATGSDPDLLRLAVLTALSPPQTDRDRWLLQVLGDEEPLEDEQRGTAGFRRFLRGVLLARLAADRVPSPPEAPQPELGELRAENERLAAEGEAARKEIEGLRAELDRAKSRAEEIQGQLQEQEKKVESLERQIAELKAIEEIIDRRESPSIPQERNP